MKKRIQKPSEKQLAERDLRRKEKMKKIITRAQKFNSKFTELLLKYSKENKDGNST